MAEEKETSVGTIYLDLKIMDTMREQIENIAKKAQQNAQKGFENVSKSVSEAMQKPVEEAAKTMSEAMQKPVEQAAKAMQKPLDDLKERFEQTDEEIQAICDRAVERAYRTPTKSTEPEVLRTVQLRPKKEPPPVVEEAKEPPPVVEEIKEPPKVNVFKVAEDSVELLNQKLDNTNALIGEQQRKLAQLAQQYAGVGAGSPEGGKLEAQMTAAEGKLISLQQTAVRTQEAIEKETRAPAIAAEKAAEAARKAQERLTAAQERAAEKVRKEQEKLAAAQERAVEKVHKAQERVAEKFRKVQEQAADKLRKVQQQSAAKASDSMKKHTTSAGKGFRSLGASIKSSIRSAFLMSALYAFFKAFKSMMSAAMTQNKQFANSLNTIKANLSAAFQPIIQAVMPMLNTLMAGLASVAKTFAAFISGIFGKTYAQSMAAAQKLQGAQKKADNNNTLGIDELNIIDKGQQEGDVDYGAVDTTGMEKAEGVAERVRAKIDELLAPLRSIDFSNLIQAFDKLKEAVAPLGKKLFAGLEWAYNNLLVPLSKWAVEKAAPAFLELFASGLEYVNKILDVFKPLGMWLWDNFLQPLASWTGGVVLEVVQQLTDWYGRLGAWIDSNKAKLEGIFAAIAPFAKAAADYVLGCINRFKDMVMKIRESVMDILIGIMDFVMGVFTGDWKQAWEGLKAIVDGVLEAILALFTYLWETLHQAVLYGVESMQMIVEPIVEWFDTTIIQPIGSFFAGLWDNVKNGASIAWNGIKGVWQTVKGWFDTNVVKPVVTMFTGLWENVKGLFNTAWESMGTALKDFINGWIGMIESLGNGIVNVVNDIINGINSIKIDIPDWAEEKFGWSDFGFSIQNVPPISLPRLATGAVIPPNGEFLAMLGDQKHGRNLEAPEGLIRQIIDDALAKQPRRDEPIQINLTVELDGDTIGRSVYTFNQRQGVKLGGAFANCY